MDSTGHLETSFPDTFFSTSSPAAGNICRVTDINTNGDHENQVTLGTPRIWELDNSRIAYPFGWLNSEKSFPQELWPRTSPCFNKRVSPRQREAPLVHKLKDLAFTRRIGNSSELECWSVGTPRGIHQCRHRVLSNVFRHALRKNHLHSAIRYTT